MAIRYYYFRAESLELADVQARMPLSAVVAVGPGVSQPSFLVVSTDDAVDNQTDLFDAMTKLGFTFVVDTAVAPVFGAIYHYGALAVEPVLPVPAAGYRYYDTTRGYERYYDGTIWRAMAPVQTVEVPFTFATASPLAVTTIRPGDRVMRSEVAVETTFDGVGPGLQLGTGASPGAILVMKDIDLTVVDTYRSFDRFQAGVATGIELVIAPGAGATQGAGRVFLEVWRA